MVQDNARNPTILAGNAKTCRTRSLDLRILVKGVKKSPLKV